MLEDSWSNFTQVPLLFKRFETHLLWLHELLYGTEDPTLFMDNEPSEALHNSKWSGQFLESFRGQMLLKNKVQSLDFASHLWPPLVGLPLAKMVQVHL